MQCQSSAEEHGTNLTARPLNIIPFGFGSIPGCVVSLETSIPEYSLRNSLSFPDKYRILRTDVGHDLQELSICRAYHCLIPRWVVYLIKGQ
jgi:hypothetical protein